MTLARTGRLATRARRTPEEIAEDLYDALPTRVYDREERSSGVLQAGPRDLRGRSPSHARSNAPTLPAAPARTSRPSPLATFSLPLSPSESAADGARISQMLRELPFVPVMDASRPLMCAPERNVFLTPPNASAPAPMWKRGAVGAESAADRSSAPHEVPTRTRRRRSILPFVTAAFGIAIGIGLWRDEAARSQIAESLARAVNDLGAFVKEAAIR